MHWNSATTFSNECARLRQEQLKEVESLPALVRRTDVQRIFGWTSYMYYTRTEGFRVSPFGYREQQRVPKAVILLWLKNSHL